MKDWKKIVVQPEKSMLSAMELLDKEGLRALLIVDKNQKLLGMITDGDVRRALLKNISLENPVSKIMNTQLTVSKLNDNRESMLAKLHALGLYHLPIVDDQNHLIGLETMDSLLSLARHNNAVVIMAGGMGKRLWPLTMDCPKPLIKIGGKPVLEILIENFIKHGFHRIYLAVNYKAEMIKNYFANGHQWGANIQYLEEAVPLGTAGALSLLKDTFTQPFFVTNADVVTGIDFQFLLRFHKEQNADATVCIREHEQKIPYGVVHCDKESHLLIKIVEKPIERYFVNAGIYILEPPILPKIPKNRFYDMTDLLAESISNHSKIATFPIKEYWLDIGRHEDLEQAHQDYESAF